MYSKNPFCCFFLCIANFLLFCDNVLYEYFRAKLESKFELEYFFDRSVKQIEAKVANLREWSLTSLDLIVQKLNNS